MGTGDSTCFLYMINAIFFNTPIETNFIGHQMAEVYRDRVYDPILGGKKGLTILDIGANVGVTSYYFSQFAKDVYAVEPSLQHFDILTRMIAFNKLQNVHPIKKAIYIKKGTYPFGGTAVNKTMRSLHAAIWDEGKPDEEVEAITIKDLIEENKIKKVDFMKLDVEGSETEILSSTAFKEVADMIGAIVVERHSWSGRHENQLNEALKSVGFEVSGIPNAADLLLAKRW